MWYDLLMNPKYGAFSSSVDPQQLSTTVLGAAKIVSGLLVFWGLLSAADGTTLFTHLNVIVTDVTVLAPLAYATWHAAEAVFGILQKVIVKLTTKIQVPAQAMGAGPVVPAV